ncbi:WhiB family transcriptional regulator [Nonomuraea sp. bgisy101]|uniref:WhiB family transcriptional regulator n=1 Tax=Nonomuraea sp. bgisy101 TaxID=3413784 RepID=UPI003D73823D
MKRAACRDVDPELFFPVSYDGPAGKRQLKQARNVCRPCPCYEACLAWALENAVDDGIWAGTTPAQRRALRANRTAV